MQNKAFNAAVHCPELDGLGRMILKIVTKLSRKYNKNVDDLFQDAVLIYLQNKHKYDPARGNLTTFAYCMLSTRLLSKKKKLKTKNVRFDIYETEPETTEYDETSLKVLESIPERKPNMKEISAITGLPVETVRGCLRVLQANMDQSQTTKFTQLYSDDT